VADVQLHDGESLEHAVNRFQKKVREEGIIGAIKRHAFYSKPGQRKRTKRALARKRALKKTHQRDSGERERPS